MASRNVVYGSPAIMAIWTEDMISPPFDGESGEAKDAIAIDFNEGL
jgi:hypothetical protein